MNILVGLILGLLVAIGGAYVHDSAIAPSDRDTRALVNWNAFNAEMRSLNESVSNGWERLTSSMPRRG